MLYTDSQISNYDDYLLCASDYLTDDNVHQVDKDYILLCMREGIESLERCIERLELIYNAPKSTMK